MEQEIYFCTTDDNVKIAYATVGSGPPLVKAANWLNHLEYDWKSPIWRYLFEELARNQHVVRYDERGNGLSDWNVDNISFNAFVDDLESVVDALGLDRFPVLGISQGGPVAIAYAVRHPEKVSHLVLFGSYARGWNKRGGSSETLELRHAEAALIRLGWGQENPAFRQLWTTLFFPDGDPEVTHGFNEMQRVSASPEMASRIFEVLGEIDVVDLLPKLNVPTLVLHCRGDEVVPFEEGRRFASLIPGSRFVPLEGRNHIPLKNEPAFEQLLEEMRRFLGREIVSPFDAGPPAQVKNCPKCGRNYPDISLNFCLEDGTKLAMAAGPIFRAPKSEGQVSTQILPSGNTDETSK
ncbi:MAG: alpha/beta hydrolase [Blastocatellia bacterium]|nr:alpha/beta hydrolase [Blastocatellia bacterium]MDQ3219504.1 alpha/beta hydrolase [Acidobacteriota bacterium]